MKLFDEWWVIYTSDKGGCPKNMGDRSFFSKALTIVGEHAFKAGMLAAANLVKPSCVTDDYEAGKEGAATIIREELDD